MFLFEGLPLFLFEGLPVFFLRGVFFLRVCPHRMTTPIGIVRQVAYMAYRGGHFGASDDHPYSHSWARGVHSL